jgi:methyl-accepting chemotaxis protein
MLNFLRQGGDAFREMDRLLTDLGVKMTGPQVSAIEAMGDAIGRLALPMQGFVNQFLAQLAPAITAVSNLIVKFFAENTKGWTVAKTLADGLVFSIRMVVGAVTLLTGVFQVFVALGSQIGQMFSELFGLILRGVSRVMKAMAELAGAVPGFGDLQASLAEGSRGAREMADGAFQMGEMYGQSAADTFAQAVQNMGSPFAGFDREFAAAQAAAQSSAASAAATSAGQSIGAAIKAASSELNAIVVGTSGGESYRNMLARGGDPRLSGGDAAKQTADNTERAADGIEDVAAAVREIPGFGQAQVAIV